MRTTGLSVATLSGTVLAAAIEKGVRHELDDGSCTVLVSSGTGGCRCTVGRMARQDSNAGSSREDPLTGCRSDALPTTNVRGIKGHVRMTGQGTEAYDGNSNQD